MKIGVISDTHNYLDPAVARLFEGVDHILHGGDIGLPRILLELGQIAPVTSVAGNTDDPLFRYPLIEVVTLAGRKFLLHHIVDPRAPAGEWGSRWECERPAGVVFGHTHRPFCETLGGGLFFNPGYAGRSRFRMERSVAILHLEETGIRPEFFPLG